MDFREYARAAGIKALLVYKAFSLSLESMIYNRIFFINPLNIYVMNVKEQAVMDIQEELSRQGKSFIAFHNELDEVMEEIVNNLIKEQESWQSSR